MGFDSRVGLLSGLEWASIFIGVGWFCLLRPVCDNIIILWLEMG